MLSVRNYPDFTLLYRQVAQWGQNYMKSRENLYGIYIGQKSECLQVVAQLIVPIVRKMV